MARANQGARKRKGKEVEPHLLEWLIVGPTAICLVLLASYLVVTGLEAGRMPRFSLQAGAIVEENGRYHVRVAVVNLGAETAAEVTVRGTLSDNETGEFVLDYLPPGSPRKGTLVFRRNPADSPLVLSVVGYREP